MAAMIWFLRWNFRRLHSIHIQSQCLCWHFGYFERCQIWIGTYRMKKSPKREDAGSPLSRARHVLWKSFIYVNLLIVYLLSPVDDYSIAVICEKIRFNKWSIFERKMNKLWTTGVMTAYLRHFRTFFGKKGELEKVIKWDILLWYLLNEVKG